MASGEGSADVWDEAPSICGSWSELHCDDGGYEGVVERVGSYFITTCF